jgi:hypothetical protein
VPKVASRQFSLAVSTASTGNFNTVHHFGCPQAGVRPGSPRLEWSDRVGVSREGNVAHLGVAKANRRGGPDDGVTPWLFPRWIAETASAVAFLDQVDGETYRRVRELFAKAIELEPEKRHAFLEKACQGNEEVLAEVESLLSFYQASDRDEP